MTRADMALPGCTPEPLGHYLKGLAVIRLVAEQKDEQALARWSSGCLILHTRLEPGDLVRFFLQEYRPTPVLSPWNKDSKLWPGVAWPDAVGAIVQSSDPRLAEYAAAIRQVSAILVRAKYPAKPKKPDKIRLLRTLRSEMPDSFVRWMDALCALEDDGVGMAPVLGSGGCDGRHEFSVNFMQRLGQVILPAAGGASAAWLLHSLFATGSPALVGAPVGQYHPGGVGGPNAAAGFHGDSLVNPWDYVLMIEGAILLASSVARRAGTQARARAALPFTFTVRSSAAGSRTLGESEASSGRQEVWLPLWARPASLGEISHLLAEGRAQVGRRSAESSTDFARAVVSLGVDRGLAGFTRFGFLKRSGKSHLAAPLGWQPVEERLHVELLEELDPWLRRLRTISQRAEAPASIRGHVRAIDDAIFAFCRAGRTEDLQEVLVAVSAAELGMARSKFGQGQAQPLAPLSLAWASACNDRSSEFRLAQSLASLYCATGATAAGIAVGPLRTHVEAVSVSPTGKVSWDPGSTAAVWRNGALLDSLVAMLERRCVDAAKVSPLEHAPVAASRPASLGDLHAFLSGQLDLAKLDRLGVALSMLRWPLWPDQRQGQPGLQVGQVPAALDRLYGICKLPFHHGPLPAAGPEGDNTAIRPDLAILARLRADDADTAVRLATRRLRGAGLFPVGTRGRGTRGKLPALTIKPGAGAAIAAALVFPIRESAIAGLMELVLMQPALTRESIQLAE